MASVFDRAEAHKKKKSKDAITMYYKAIGTIDDMDKAMIFTQALKSGDQVPENPKVLAKFLEWKLEATRDQSGYKEKKGIVWQMITSGDHLPVDPLALTELLELKIRARRAANTASAAVNAASAAVNTARGQ